MLASDSGVARGKPEIARYDPSRQGAAGAALLTAPKAYNPDADVTADAGKEQKKTKKKKVPVPPDDTAQLHSAWSQPLSLVVTIDPLFLEDDADCGTEEGYTFLEIFWPQNVLSWVQHCSLWVCAALMTAVLSLQKSAAPEEAAAVDGSAAATNGAMEIDAPSTSAEPAVNGAATAEKKKKKKKRTAEEAALEAAPAEDGAAAEEAPKPKKKKDKAAANGVADAPTTEKKVQQSFPFQQRFCNDIASVVDVLEPWGASKVCAILPFGGMCKV